MCSCFYKPKLSDGDYFSMKILRFLVNLPIPSNIRKQALLLFLYLFFTAILFAQQKIIGVVTGVNDSPLAGASITIKGSKDVTTTTMEGAFMISARPEDVLIISFVGYNPREVAIGAATSLKISLALSFNDLDQVVVTGYTSQKVKDITGSVAVVKPKDLTAIPGGQVEQMLQGRVAGLNVITTGEPGSSSIVRIHGIGNLGNVTPLYIIDGVQGDINSINPYDIESLQVLKDAGAYSIYGVRGANGVIVVTTKKGKTAKASVQYDFYIGVQKPLKGLELLNPDQIANLYWKALKNSGLADPNTGKPYFPTLYGDSTVPVLPDYYFAGNSYGLFEGDPRVNPNLYSLDSPAYQIVKFNKTGTNWYHEMFKPAISQSHTLSVSGGSEKNAYLFSVGYLDQQGTLLNTYLKRLTARVNTSFTVNDHIRIGENIQFLSNDNPRSSGEIGATLTTPPYLPVYDIKGGWSSGGGFYAGPAGNPVAIRNLAKDNKNLNWQVFGNAYAEADFLNHFTIRTSFGGTFNYYYNYAYTFGTYNLPTTNSLTENSGFGKSWTWTNTINYSLLIRKHSIKVLAGTEQVSNYNRSESGKGTGFFTDNPNYRILANSSPTGQNATSSVYSSFLSSLISRLDYGFDSKYLVSITLRRDGSSVFASATRYGWFPAFSAAWRMTEENFMKDSKWLTDLKVRASWGKTGYDGNTGPLNQYTLYGSNPFLSYYDINGTGNSALQGFRTSYIGNPATSWQQDIVSNFGIESILWKGKLSLTADWYVKKTNGLLLPAQLPDILGDATPPNVNIGNIRNRGVDLLLGSKGKFSKDWSWDLAITFTTYDNKIIKLNGAEDLFYYNQWPALVNNSVGHPVGSFYGYKLLGLFRDDGDVSKSPGQLDAAPGRFKYQDLNKDDTVNEKDMTFIGNPNPKFTAGINIGINYKNFDFSAFFYGSFGNDVVNEIGRLHDIYLGGDAKSETALYNSWAPDHTNARAPVPELSLNWSNGAQPDTYPIEKGTYFRCRSMILGYTLPRSLTGKYKISRMRFYIQAMNLFTLTKYSGLDPELSGSTLAFGVDWGSYPNNQQQFLFGVNLNF